MPQRLPRVPRPQRHVEGALIKTEADVLEAALLEAGRMEAHADALALALFSANRCKALMGDVPGASYGKRVASPSGKARRFGRVQMRHRFHALEAASRVRRDAEALQRAAARGAQSRRACKRRQRRQPRRRV